MLWEVFLFLWVREEGVTPWGVGELCDHSLSPTPDPGRVWC